MQKDFERNLGQWVNKRASEISEDDVERLHGKLAKERGPYTANRTVQLLRAVFNKGIAWKLVQGDNPAKGISLFEERARERFLSSDEMKKLLEKLAEMAPGNDTRDFIMLCLLTGARKSNVLSMRWKDVERQLGVWTIEETKNGSSQTIPLTGAEIALLEQRKDVLKAKYKTLPEFVFPSNSRTGHIIDLKKSWDVLRTSAGIPDCTIHDLRRNLGSWMASENVNLALIKNALHHKDMKTTIAVYARTAKDAVRQGRQVAHTAMLQAAGVEQPAAGKVVNFKPSHS
jgi:integrase